MKSLEQIRKEYKQELVFLEADINAYKGTSTDNGPALNELVKTLTTRLSYLSTVRTIFHDQWQKRVKYLIENDSSVARAENFAHVDFPELYELRNKIRSAYEVVNAIRSNLSYLKKELGTINN